MEIFLRRPQEESIVFTHPEPGRRLEREVVDCRSEADLPVIEYSIEINPVSTIDGLELALLYIEEFRDSMSDESFREMSGCNYWTLMVHLPGDIPISYLTLHNRKFDPENHHGPHQKFEARESFHILRIKERSCARLMARLEKLILELEKVENVM